MTKVINLSCLFFMFSGDPFYECVFFFLAKTPLYPGSSLTSLELFSQSYLRDSLLDYSPQQGP